MCCWQRRYWNWHRLAKQMAGCLLLMWHCGDAGRPNPQVAPMALVLVHYHYHCLRVVLHPLFLPVLVVSAVPSSPHCNYSHSSCMLLRALVLLPGPVPSLARYPGLGTCCQSLVRLIGFVKVLARHLLHPPLSLHLIHPYSSSYCSLERSVLPVSEGH